MAISIIKALHSRAPLELSGVFAKRKPKQKNYAKCSKPQSESDSKGGEGGLGGVEISFNSPIYAYASRQTLSFTARDQFRYHLHKDNSTDTFRVSPDLLHHL